MPHLFNVPAAVKKIAAQGLALHKESPMEGVGGIKIAEALTGESPVEPAILARMRRFFVVNERHYLTEAGLSHRPLNSPLMRSWDLHGGQAGKTWCEAAYVEARKGGFLEEDPWVTLLTSKVEQVYEALSFGAWRWEYDMDPPRAARFVEEYHRATGLNLDLPAAFGRDGKAVAEAMIRRAQNESPFKVLARNLLREEYRAVAKQDMAEVKKSIGRASLNWPGLVGMAVIGAREPKLARPVMEGYPEPPMLGRDPLPVMAYSEPVASYVSYFHPRGAQFVPNHPPGILAEMAAFVQTLHAGKRLDEGAVLDTMSRARAWTGGNGLAGNLGHVLIEAARREDYPVFLDALPLDSPVRRPFEQFIGVRSR